MAPHQPTSSVPCSRLWTMLIEVASLSETHFRITIFRVDVDMLATLELLAKAMSPRSDIADLASRPSCRLRGFSRASTSMVVAVSLIRGKTFSTPCRCASPLRPVIASTTGRTYSRDRNALRAVSSTPLHVEMPSQEDFWVTPRRRGICSGEVPQKAPICSWSPYSRSAVDPVQESAPKRRRTAAKNGRRGWTDRLVTVVHTIIC